MALTVRGLTHSASYPYPKLASGIAPQLPATPEVDIGVAHIERVRVWLTQRAVAEFKPGVYRHFKGGTYTALFLAAHHETRVPMVVYISHSDRGLNVRPLIRPAIEESSWTDYVALSSGVPRFEFLRAMGPEVESALVVLAKALGVQCGF